MVLVRIGCEGLCHGIVAILFFMLLLNKDLGVLIRADLNNHFVVIVKEVLLETIRNVYSEKKPELMDTTIYNINGCLIAISQLCV